MVSRSVWAKWVLGLSLACPLAACGSAFAEGPVPAREKTRIATGCDMTTKVEVSASGIVTGRVEMKNVKVGRGYTGSVKVYLCDEAGHTLHVSPKFSYGVDSGGFAPGRRKATFEYNYPAELAPQIRSAKIVMIHDPKDRSDDWVEEFEKAKPIIMTVVAAAAAG